MTAHIEADGRELTPELLDLMQHEKAIEQGLSTFLDVGHALLAIKVDKKYRAAGYATFDDYCQRRWSISRERGRQLINAAITIDELPTIVGIPEPRSESQVRPLTVLDTPDDRADAWAAAVEIANGEQPTAADVQAVVEQIRPRPAPEPSERRPSSPIPRPVAKRPVTKPEHPAPFSDDILDVIAGFVVGFDRVLDPFAGVGNIHRLRGLAGVRETIGIELEPEWAEHHPDTITGNALDMVALVGAETISAIVTSPAYGNRMADHHNAQDDSVRLTYTHTIGRKLTEGNTGAMQWGQEYRDLHLAVWTEATKALRPGGLFVLNVKDHVRGDQIQDVSAWHVDTLTRRLNYELESIRTVNTRGVMAGANAESRVPCELIFVLSKAPEP